MNLDDKQKEIGKLNFLTVLGSLEGDFLSRALAAPAVGPFLFGYGPVEKPIKTGIVGTGNEGCQAMIEQSPLGSIDYVGYHDIRPTQIARGRRTFQKIYGQEKGSQVKFHETWEGMLADPEIEAIVIATPLWTHKRFAVEAMRAGKHVLCEKLMAHSVAECKEMVRVSEETGKVLSIGHQRHYSPLYDLTLRVVQSGVLGDIRHVRALWHRNNSWTLSDPHRPDKPSPADPDWGVSGDSWCPPIPAEDKDVAASLFGYKDANELVRWRLFDRTGGGLMAELGSHQLDACSLFLNKVHPEKLLATGGKFFFTDDRECEDHVYCMYQMPGGVTLTYSTISSNAQEGYGEVVMGTRGTLCVMNERDVMLFKEREAGETMVAEDMYVTCPVDPQTNRPSLKWTPSTAVSKEAGLAKAAYEKLVYFSPPGATDATVNRGYFTELEAFAFAIRNPEYKVRCSGRVALADAVMALSANVSMRSKQPILFKTEWYDPASAEVPETAAAAVAKNA
jgi:predicted dehydrogenase